MCRSLQLDPQGQAFPTDVILTGVADAGAYFGLHRVKDGWVYREWAPDACQLYFMGEFNGWHRTADPMFPLGNGCWVLYLPGEDALWDGCRVSTISGNAVLREGILRAAHR